MDQLIALLPSLRSYMEDLAQPWNYQNWWVGTGMEMILGLGQYSTQNNIVCSSQLVHIGTYFVYKETFWASKINSKVYTQRIHATKTI